MRDSTLRKIAIGLIFAWMLFFAFLPYIFVFIASFLTPGKVDFFSQHLTIENYLILLDPVFLTIFIRSLITAFITAFVCLLIGYPFAYLLARLPTSLRHIALFLIVIPFWTSSLIRVYAIITIVKTQGLLNSFLLNLGIIHQPLHLMYTQLASQIGLIYSLLPFMVLPLYAVLEKFDWRLVDAARDLGASKKRMFCQIIIPLSMPGILSGILLVLLPAMTLFYIPDILGGAKSILLGNLIQTQFMEMHNWPVGSSVSVILTCFMALLLIIYTKFTSAKARRGLL